MKIHVFQHVAFEGLGQIQPWLQSHSHEIQTTRFYKFERPPVIEGNQGLIIMGGPMGTGDKAEFPWLTTEKKAIEQALKLGCPVLGVCLGAQLIADVLGARVLANPQKEIGWWPIQITEDGRSSGVFNEASSLNVFHWHGDTFDLPQGARHLATSDLCQNQAFLYDDQVLALQFHLEVGLEEARLMVHHGQRELTQPQPGLQSAEDILSRAALAQTQPYLNHALARLFTAS